MELHWGAAWSSAKAHRVAPLGRSVGVSRGTAAKGAQCGTEPERSMWLHNGAARDSAKAQHVAVQGHSLEPEPAQGMAAVRRSVGPSYGAMYDCAGAQCGATQGRSMRPRTGAH